MIEGTTKVLGVLGSPIEHTLSPYIHNTLSTLCGINQVYVPYHGTGSVQAMIEGAYALGIKGMNVTVPYKQEVMDYLISIDDKARMVGAVNTLVRKEGGFAGYNTDVTGLADALEMLQVAVEGRDVIILGAGGAARAAAYMSVDKAGSLTIINRTYDKAVRLEEEIRDNTGFDNITCLSVDDCMQADVKDALCIQCSSVGLADAGKALIESSRFYHDKVGVVYDCVYNPEVTRTMALARDNGCEAYNGLLMLLCQAVDAFELFHDVKISKEMTLEVYELLRKKIG